MSPRPPAPAATPLSGVVAASGPAIQWYSLLSGLMRTSWTLARTSLALAIAMSSSACLVLSPPEYDKPEQTAPMLVASAAFPDLRQTIYVFDDTPFVEFGGAVLSEDAGDPVQLAIYLDYGQRNAADRPYRNVVYPFEPIPPGTLADGPRTFLPKRWYPSVHAVLNGCHTATLMASHGFDADVCLAIEVVDAPGVEIAYYATDGFQSEAGRLLAEALIRQLPHPPGWGPSVAHGMRLPILRETRCPTVRIKLGPVAEIAEMHSLLVAAANRALRSWIEPTP